jgi:hypothetical protein
VHGDAGYLGAEELAAAQDRLREFAELFGMG